MTSTEFEEVLKEYNLERFLIPKISKLSKEELKELIEWLIPNAKERNKKHDS